MMVAMGLYDKLIHAITHLKSEFKNSMKLLIPIFRSGERQSLFFQGCLSFFWKIIRFRQILLLRIDRGQSSVYFA